MKKRTCLGLECNKELIKDEWFCSKCTKKNKKIRDKKNNRRIRSGHYYRSE